MSVQAPETDDRERVASLIQAGMLPDKAAALLEMVRKVEVNSEPFQQAQKKAALLEVMLSNGVSRWTAFTLLFCHTSPHDTAITELENDYADDA